MLLAVSTDPDPDETDQRPGLTTTRPYCPVQRKRNRLRLHPVWAPAEAAAADSAMASMPPIATQLEAENPTASSTESAHWVTEPKWLAAHLLPVRHQRLERCEDAAP